MCLLDEDDFEIDGDRAIVDMASRASGGVEGDRAEEEEVERRARVVRARRAPTREEREAHELTHVPYRGWCRRCLQTRGLADPDLVVKDGPSGAVGATRADQKGPGCIWIVSRVKRFVEDCGRADIVFKTDGETSLVAVCTELRHARPGVSTIPQQPATGDSDGNGMIERGVQEWQQIGADAKRRRVEDIDQRFVPPSSGVAASSSGYRDGPDADHEMMNDDDDDRDDEGGRADDRPRVREQELVEGDSAKRVRRAASVSTGDQDMGSVVFFAGWRESAHSI